MHPEKPCSGIVDSIDIEATIQDVDVQEKFEEIYGKPKLSDYEMLNKLLSNFLIRWLSKILR